MATFSKGAASHDDLVGRYSNYFKVGHNAYEFLIDFGQYYEYDAKQETIHSRIVTNPVYVKRLLSTLSRAIDLYESKHGSIEDQAESDYTQ